MPDRPGLPAGFVDELRRLRDDYDPHLDVVLREARFKGWTVGDLAAALDVTRQAIHLRIHHGSKPARRSAWRKPIRPEVVARLRELQALATVVRGSTPEGHPSRTASVELAALQAQLIGERYTKSAIARAMGLTPGAVGARLRRHGHAPSTREAPYLGRPKGHLAG